MALGEDFAARDIERLVVIYGRAREDIIRSLARGGITQFQLVRGKELLAQVDATIADLREASGKWFRSRLPKFYQAGMRLQADASGLPLPTLSGIHRQAIGRIAADIERRLEREALPSAARSAGDAFRRARQTIVSHERLMERLGVSQIRGLTVKDLARDIAQTLRDGATERLKGVTDPAMRARLKEVAEGRLIRIVGKDGKERAYSLPAYAKTVALTASRMAHSEGVIQTAKEFGEDLVQISVHARACPRCVPLQGRVFSITGKDKNFPLLGEANRPPIHPNCAHVLLPAPKAFLQRRGLYDGLARWSKEGRPVESAADYQRLLQEIRAAGKVPKPKPAMPAKPPKAPKVPEAPPWRPPDSAEGILMAPGQLDRLMEVWEGIGGEAARRKPFGQPIRPTIARIVVRPDAVRRNFSGIYDDAYGGAVGLSPKTRKELAALLSASSLRRRIDATMFYANASITREAEVILGAAPESFRNRVLLDEAIKKATLPQLQALALRNVESVREAFRTLIHETAHGTQAIPPSSYGWRSYVYTSSASAWQEAATELWARTAFSESADALLPGLKAARKGIMLRDAQTGAYPNQVKALRGVFEVVGFSPSEAREALVEIKFNTPVHVRAVRLQRLVTDAWRVSDAGVRAQIHIVLREGLGTMSTARDQACSDVPSKLRHILEEAVRNGKATRPPVTRT